MIREWLQRKKVSAILLSIFDRLKLSLYLKMNIIIFVIVNKSKYNLVLDNTWLTELRYEINKWDARYWKNNEKRDFII